MASRVVSVRLKDADAARLERQARLLQRSTGETAALLLAEKLKEEEFPLIEFRPTLIGRQAFVEGTSLAVWEVAAVARAFGGEGRRVAEHLDWPLDKVKAALAYAEAYPGEINPLVAHSESMTYDKLKRLLPGLRLVQA